jgi:hypothetical protein
MIGWFIFHDSFSAIHRGMSMSQVRRAVGSPQEIITNGIGIVRWTYTAKLKSHPETSQVFFTNEIVIYP